MKNKKNSRHRRRARVTNFIIFISIIMIVCTGTLFSVQNYGNPNLYGKWKSEETNKTIQIKKNGQIQMKDTGKIGKFIILSSDTMSYTVDDKTFNMFYQLNGRQLEWGLSQLTPETFKYVGK
ncbi:MAG: hypothetical protein ACRCSG_04730 [Cellulosilyticaceae bacterium]